MPRIFPADGVVESRLDGDLLLLNRATRHMYRLNPTGELIWRALGSGDFESIVRRVCERFDVDERQARVDADALIARLIAAGLALEGDAAESGATRKAAAEEA